MPGKDEYGFLETLRRPVYDRCAVQREWPPSVFAHRYKSPMVREQTTAPQKP